MAKERPSENRVSIRRLDNESRSRLFDQRTLTALGADPNLRRDGFSAGGIAILPLDLTEPLSLESMTEVRDFPTTGTVTPNPRAIYVFSGRIAVNKDGGITLVAVPSSPEEPSSKRRSKQMALPAIPETLNRVTFGGHADERTARGLGDIAVNVAGLMRVDSSLGQGEYTATLAPQIFTRLESVDSMFARLTQAIKTTDMTHDSKGHLVHSTPEQRMVEARKLWERISRRLDLTAEQARYAQGFAPFFLSKM